MVSYDIKTTFKNPLVLAHPSKKRNKNLPDICINKIHSSFQANVLFIVRDCCHANVDIVSYIFRARDTYSKLIFFFVLRFCITFNQSVDKVVWSKNVETSSTLLLLL